MKVKLVKQESQSRCETVHKTILKSETKFSTNIDKSTKKKSSLINDRPHIDRRLHMKSENDPFVQCSSHNRQCVDHKQIEQSNEHQLQHSRNLHSIASNHLKSGNTF
jgi:hypothetical protein